MALVHGVIYTLVGFLLLTWFGNMACRALFKRAGLKDESLDTTNGVQPAGWIIGWLERTLLAIGMVTQSWEVLAAVIALKTVARFKELDDQKFAEYFLVGSLFSILWAVLVTSAWLVYDRHIGSDLRTKISNAFEITDESADACVITLAESQMIEFRKLCSREAD